MTGFRWYRICVTLTMLTHSFTCGTFTIHSSVAGCISADNISNFRPASSFHLATPSPFTPLAMPYPTTATNPRNPSCGVHNTHNRFRPCGWLFCLKRNCYSCCYRFMSVAITVYYRCKLDNFFSRRFLCCFCILLSVIMVSVYFAKILFCKICSSFVFFFKSIEYQLLFCMCRITVILDSCSNDIFCNSFCRNGYICSYIIYLLLYTVF